ncbi:hypothetical protein F2Q70_00003506 [Brassica cretica]|uniref:Uncharacterized protein n=1 Tax=Brassica cretica TaxID=69181 RepID=A0A8S9IJZ3_BRACR|nr:hypothetical protein F2Q70_00003506 [Brassica cretica]
MTELWFLLFLQHWWGDRPRGRLSPGNGRGGGSSTAASLSSDTALTDQELPTLSTDDTQVSSDIETETGDDSTPLPSTDLPESSTPPTTVTETENAEIADDNTNPSPDILHISIILSIRPCVGVPHGVLGDIWMHLELKGGEIGDHWMSRGWERGSAATS